MTETTVDMAQVRALAETFRDSAIRHDRDGSFPHDHFARLRDAGLLGLVVPARLGGGAGGLRQAAGIVEQRAALHLRGVRRTEQRARRTPSPHSNAAGPGFIPCSAASRVALRASALSASVTGMDVYGIRAAMVLRPAGSMNSA